MQKLAIYDMDKTITRRATLPGFLRFAGMRVAPVRQLLWPLVGLLLLGYGLKLLDRARLKELMHQLLLGPRQDPARLAEVAEDFAAQLAVDGLFAAALARIASDRAEGYRLVMATASYAYYASAVGELLGLETIATRSRRDKGDMVLPLIDGENCYGPAKLGMIEDWLATQDLARTDIYVRFYSDHPSDRPVLDWADEAYAVNPDAKMVALAAERGWPILW
jgi:phosphoserine phosphatase